MGIGCHAVWAFFGEYVFQDKVLFHHNETFDNCSSIKFPFTIVIITEIYAIKLI